MNSDYAEDRTFQYCSQSLQTNWRKIKTTYVLNNAVSAVMKEDETVFIIKKEDDGMNIGKGASGMRTGVCNILIVFTIARFSIISIM